MFRSEAEETSDLGLNLYRTRRISSHLPFCDPPQSIMVGCANYVEISALFGCCLGDASAASGPFNVNPSGCRLQPKKALSRRALLNPMSSRPGLEIRPRWLADACLTGSSCIHPRCDLSCYRRGWPTALRPCCNTRRPVAVPFWTPSGAQPRVPAGRAGRGVRFL